MKMTSTPVMGHACGVAGMKKQNAPRFGNAAALYLLMRRRGRGGNGAYSSSEPPPKPVSKFAFWTMIATAVAGLVGGGYGLATAEKPETRQTARELGQAFPFKTTRHHHYEAPAKVDQGKLAQYVNTIKDNVAKRTNNSDVTRLLSQVPNIQPNQLQGIVESLGELKPQSSVYSAETIFNTFVDKHVARADNAKQVRELKAEGKRILTTEFEDAANQSLLMLALMLGSVALAGVAAVKAPECYFR